MSDEANVPRPRLLRRTDAAEVARLHRALFPETFFAGLGERFLRHFYEQVAEGSKTLCAVLEDPVSGHVVGFALGTMEPGFYARVVRTGPFTTAWALLAGLFRSRAVWKGMVRSLRLVRRLFHAVDVAGALEEGIEPPDGPLVRYTYLAVHPDFRHRGNAQRLVTHFAEQAFRRGAARVAGTIVASNVASQNLHKRLGWNMRTLKDQTCYIWLDRN